MSQLVSAWEQAPEVEASPVSVREWHEPPGRSILQPILMLIPLVLSGGGALFDSPIMADFAFLSLAALMAVFLIAELGRFSDRFGMGGVVLFAGVLIWFCHDYFKTWFLVWVPNWHGVLPSKTVTYAAFCHVVFVTCMVLGIRWRFGRGFAELFTKFPEPRRVSDYFWIVVVTQIIGLMPYFVFTAEPFYMAIYHSVVMGRTGSAAWTVGRTGNANYSYGAYVAQILEFGSGGAILAAFCVIFLRQGLFKNLVCIFIWVLWLATAFGTGTRGDIVKMVMPVVAFVFIRYHVQAQEFLHKYSLRAYLGAGAIFFAAIVIVQTQIRFRNLGFENVSFSKVSLTNIEGNEMFSASLIGFDRMPQQHDFFYNSFPGEMVILPIPNFLYWCVIAPMPRALWTSKPIDPSNIWYNAIFTGRSTVGGGAIEGTTISQGAVGCWYFRYGFPGVIEGGLFLGWLMGIFERALYNNNGRPISFFAALLFFIWLFRSYRGVDPSILANTMVILVGLVICIVLTRPFLGIISRK